MAAALRRRAEALGVAARIEWRGALAQPEVLAAYRRADLFVLAAKAAADGDRDGLPNVLVEAQSQAVACIATDFSAIPELIEHGSTGLLVPPGNPWALAGALSSMIRDPARRRALGAAGERRARRCFALATGIEILAKRFGLPHAGASAGAEGAPAPAVELAEME
jgi:glycosyltransferase involved in cell wall biosynthesis